MLLEKEMKSVKFCFQEEQNNIMYEEYFFNGKDAISIPKDIEIKDISGYSFNLSWNIEKKNTSYIDYDIIQYSVELRKENEEFSEVYKGKDLKCAIHNLEMNTDYEIRIRCIFNDIIGQWSEIIKAQTIEYDSIILKDQDNKDELYKKIYEWTGYKKMELIYRGTRDGMKAKEFHDKCDKKGPTITLYEFGSRIFGGYSSISWSSDGIYHSAPDCFIFTLVNSQNKEPTKFPLKDNDLNTVYHGLDYGPTFGYDIVLDKKDF